MTGDWLGNSRLTTPMKWTHPVRFPKICKPVSSYLYVKGRRDQPVARMRFRTPGRNAPRFYEAVCRAGGRPFRLRGNLNRFVELVRGRDVIACANFATEPKPVSTSPLWQEQVKCNILGVLSGKGIETYWLCSRGDFIVRTIYIVNEAGQAEMSFIYGSNCIRVLDSEDNPDRLWLLALCWFIAQIQGDEAP